MNLKNILDYALEYINKNTKCDVAVYTYLDDYPNEDFAKLPYLLGGLNVGNNRILQFTGNEEELEWRFEIRSIKYYTKKEFEKSEYNFDGIIFEDQCNDDDLYELIILAKLVSKQKLKDNDEDKLHYVYLKCNEQFVSYNPGHIGDEGYYLTGNIDKAFYFGYVPTRKHLLKICEQVEIDAKNIEIIPDEHYVTGLSNLRKIVYKRNKW